MMKMTTTMNNDIIHNLAEALDYVLKYYLPGATVRGSIDGDRGTLCYILLHCGQHWFLTFNRSWFKAFSKIYKGQPEGIGQSFKMSMLTRAATLDAMLMSMTPKAHAYILESKVALNYIDTNNTKRIPSTETTHEGSVPAKMLRRLEHPIIC
jgi:hypothetical protein